MTAKKPPKRPPARPSRRPRKAGGKLLGRSWAVHHTWPQAVTVGYRTLREAQAVQEREGGFIVETTEMRLPGGSAASPSRPCPRTLYGHHKYGGGSTCYACGAKKVRGRKP